MVRVINGVIFLSQHYQTGHYPLPCMRLAIDQPTLKAAFLQNPIQVPTLSRYQLQELKTEGRNKRNIDLAKIRVIGDKARDSLTTTVTSVLDVFYGSRLTAEQKKEAAEYSLRTDQTIQLLRSSRDLTEDEFYDQCVTKTLEACEKYFQSTKPPITIELKDNSTKKAQAVTIFRNNNFLQRLIQLSRGLSAVENLVAENKALVVRVVDKCCRHVFTKPRGIDQELRQNLINDGFARPDGLLAAAKSFDPYIGYKFATFAFRCVRNALYKESLEQHQLLPLNPRNAARVSNKHSCPRYAAAGLNKLKGARSFHFSHSVEPNDDESRTIVDFLAAKPISYDSTQPDDNLIAYQSKSSSSEVNRIFWGLPDDYKFALRKLGKEKPLYRLAFELFYLSELEEDQILEIARKEIDQETTPKGVTMALTISKDWMENFVKYGCGIGISDVEIPELPPNEREAITRQYELAIGSDPVNNGSTIPLRKLIDELKEHPEWALLLPDNEAYVFCRTYHLEETYEHNPFDVVTPAGDIGKRMKSRINGEEGLTRNRINQFLTQGKEKILSLMKMVSSEGKDFDGSEIEVSKELLSVIKMCRVFPFTVQDTVSESVISQIIQRIKKAKHIDRENIARDFSISTNDVDKIASIYILEEAIREGKSPTKINYSFNIGPGNIKKIFEEAKTRMIKEALLDKAKREQLLNLLIQDPPQTPDIRALQESSLFKRLVEVNKSEAERRSKNEMALAS